MTQDWRQQHFLSALNLKNYSMEVGVVMSEWAWSVSECELMG